jgi:hypothetical protein
MGWQDDARRTIVSEKHELNTFPGYWVKVKKYSISARDEIQSVLSKFQKSIDKKALMSLVGKRGTNLSESELRESLTPEEIGAVLDMGNAETSQYSYVRIKNGIAEHNFCDEGVSKETESFAKDILDYSDIAQEILLIIEEYNRPLAEVTSKQSTTSPNGFTTGASLNTEMNSQTDDNQPN